MPEVSLIIPAYNEAARLPRTLAEIRAYLAAKPELTVEIIVVDDGSTDGTAEAASAAYPGVHVLRQPNGGKGSAVAAGMLAAAGAWRLMLDADGSTPIGELDGLLAARPAADVVIGSRYLHAESITVKQGWKRRLVSRGGNLLIRALAVPGVTDTQCGFKLFSAAAAEAVFPKLTVKGWLFDVEALAAAAALGFTIAEVPVRWHDDSESKLRTTRTALKSLRDLSRIRRGLRSGAYTGR